jgi:hypothetical protein
MKISSSQKLKNLLKLERSIPSSHTAGGVTTTTWFLPKTKKYHRQHGPAFESTNGHKEYWVNGVKHRIGAPAVILPDGTEEYYENGIRHRMDGPAIIEASGGKRYFIDGHEIPEYDYMKIINNDYGKAF